ncbi:NAD(+) synthase [bacterium C-53]|nr:NAD(+) synthase [Lachnospiraceae bacterium]NBI03775.1 NAD(+) synthase [Lachnospiraceae bacterium]RKJ09183.1 NAD(+) synthase [bacterium C-53]
MEQGFLKIAAVTPKIKVADPEYNADEIIRLLEEAEKSGARIAVFPELCLSGYTCADLFLQDILLRSCEEQLIRIVEETDDFDILSFIGLPVEKDGKLYNAAAVIHQGNVLAFIPKANIPSYAEFYEGRHFTPGNRAPEPFLFGEWEVPFGTDILFQNGDSLPELVLAAEICEDVWVADTPGTSHALAGANVLVNLSASDEAVGKDTYREMLVKSASARLLSAYIYSSAGEGESSSDLVFGGHNLIAENGVMLAQSELFTTGILYADIDVRRLCMERRKMNTFPRADRSGYVVVPFELEDTQTELTRKFEPLPFVPQDTAMREKRCEQILSIQAMGLKKRYEHTGCKTAVLGISGGLDSTLALLVTVRAFDLLSLPRRDIVCVTLPCFGTTDRTYENACRLTEALGCTLKEIDIKAAVSAHFRDIGQDENCHDVTYENAQARERTQVLMDVANRMGGLVIGTGDMSELALGWATYNADHMSMYGVNAGVPKTLVRHLVKYYADTCDDEVITKVLEDVLDTPVSPELLPPVDGVISQKTEDLVGPYELHDFFLYYALRFGYEPAKIYRIAQIAFRNTYNKETILKWLKTFYTRFFSQQFKRSCLPDGPKVGSVAVSPRGDLRMPSDACARLWKEQVERL